MRTLAKRFFVGAMAATYGLALPAVACEVIQGGGLGCSGLMDAGYTNCSVGQDPNTEVVHCVAAKPCAATVSAVNAPAFPSACFAILRQSSLKDSMIEPIAQVLIDAMGAGGHLLFSEQMTGFLAFPDQWPADKIRRPIKPEDFVAFEDAFAPSEYFRFDGGFERLADGALQGEFFLDKALFGDASVFIRFKQVVEGNIDAGDYGEYVLESAELQR